MRVAIAVSSSGNSVTATISYLPNVQWLLRLPPPCLISASRAPTGLRPSLKTLMSCSVQVTKLTKVAIAFLLSTGQARLRDRGYALGHADSKSDGSRLRKLGARQNSPPTTEPPAMPRAPMRSWTTLSPRRPQRPERTAHPTREGVEPGNQPSAPSAPCPSRAWTSELALGPGTPRDPGAIRAHPSPSPSGAEGGGSPPIKLLTGWVGRYARGGRFVGHSPLRRAPRPPPPALIGRPTPRLVAVGTWKRCPRVRLP